MHLICNPHLIICHLLVYGFWCLQGTCSINRGVIANTGSDYDHLVTMVSDTPNLTSKDKKYCRPNSFVVGNVQDYFSNFVKAIKYKLCQPVDSAKPE